MNPKTFAMYQIGAGAVFVTMGAFLAYGVASGSFEVDYLGRNGTFGLAGLACGLGVFRLARGILAFRRFNRLNNRS
jgi:hypothetical protein